MRDKIIQCCYTNVTLEESNGQGAGWRTVAVSPDIPSEAYESCSKLQSLNSRIEQSMTDEDGNILNLYEIKGDANYVYVMRTQYGLTDQTGRRNMFAHAYILSWNDEIALKDPNQLIALKDPNKLIQDPNQFLGIANENFKYSIKEALEIPETFVRTEPLEIQQALNIAGLDTSKYATLIQSIYAQAVEMKNREILYIQYDGSEEQMKAMIYCIYMGLPFYMRKMLHIASSNCNSSDVNIIFSKYAAKQKYYFIPETGESSILTDKLSKKIQRKGFIDVAARNLELLENNYFTRLESRAKEFGDATASNELLLKVAHSWALNKNLLEEKSDKYSDEDLEWHLSDALGTNTYGNENMEQYIAKMLNLFLERGLILTEENERSLFDRLAASNNKELHTAVKNYNAGRLMQIPINDAACRLGLMPQDELKSYMEELKQSEKGLEVLDAYYAEVVLAAPDITWDKLQKIYNETAFFKNRPRTIDKLDYCAGELYRKSLINENGSLNIRNSYEDYIAFTKILFGTSDIQRREIAAKEEFWEKVHFLDISWSNEKLYEKMYTETENAQRIQLFMEIKRSIEQYGKEKFFDTMNIFFRKNEDLLTKEEVEHLRTLLEECITIYSVNKGKLELKWCGFLARTGLHDTGDIILAIRRALNIGDYDNFVTLYKEMTQIAVKYKSVDEVLKEIDETVLVKLKKNDTQTRDNVPLDAWLCVGEHCCDNAFDIWEVYNLEPQILLADTEEVLDESNLFSQANMLSQAESYIKSKGLYAKKVKEWITEYKNSKKAKKAPKGENQIKDFFGRFIKKK